MQICIIFITVMNAMSCHSGWRTCCTTLLNCIFQIMKVLQWFQRFSHQKVAIVAIIAPEMTFVLNSIKLRPLQGENGLIESNLPPPLQMISSHSFFICPCLSSAYFAFFLIYLPPPPSSHPPSIFSYANPSLPLLLSCRLSPSLLTTPWLRFPLPSSLPSLRRLFKVISVFAVIALRITHRSKPQHLTKRCSLTLSAATRGVIGKVHSSSHPIIPADTHTHCTYTLTVVDTFNLPLSGLPKGRRQLNSS